MKAKVMSLMVFVLLVAGSLSAQVEQKTMGEKAKKPRMTEEEMIQKQTERKKNSKVYYRQSSNETIFIPLKLLVPKVQTSILKSRNGKAEMISPPLQTFQTSYV